MLPLPRRWTFEGFDDNGFVTFPQTFVRMVSRPTFVNQAGFAFQPIPCWVGFRQCNIKYVYGDKPNKNIKSGFFHLYNGAGILLEEWHIREIKRVFAEYIGEWTGVDEETDLEWRIDYSECTYYAMGSKAIRPKCREYRLLNDDWE